MLSSVALVSARADEYMAGASDGVRGIQKEIGKWGEWILYSSEQTSLRDKLSSELNPTQGP